VEVCSENPLRPHYACDAVNQSVTFIIACRSEITFQSRFQYSSVIWCELKFIQSEQNCCSKPFVLQSQNEAASQLNVWIPNLPASCKRINNRANCVCNLIQNKINTRTSVVVNQNEHLLLLLTADRQQVQHVHMHTNNIRRVNNSFVTTLE